MQTREKEDCRNTFRKERPLIAALQELLGPEVVSEAQGQAGLVIHTRNDRLQIRTVGRTKNVHGIAVLGSPFLRNSLRFIRAVLFVAADHVHLKHRDRAIQRKQGMTHVVTAAEQPLLLSRPRT